MNSVDSTMLEVAIGLSQRTPPSRHAFSVGCVIVSASGEEIASGYSRELGENWHAEEVALNRACTHENLKGATLYSSMEPCSARRSARESCCAKIISAGISRVVFALREPPIFVEGRGVETLVAAGITVEEIPELGVLVESINRHLQE